MSLIPMNVEQMRRKAQENAKAKLQQQKDFKNQVDTMSRHDVGNLYDVRAIMKSKQFKEQKNHLVIQTPKLYIPFGVNYNFKIKSLLPMVATKK